MSPPRAYMSMYKGFWPIASERIYQLVINNIDSNTDSICEIGFASGHLIAMLALRYNATKSRPYKLYGVEIRKEAYEETKAKFRSAGIEATLFHGDAMNLFGHCSIIYSTGLLQCLRNKERSNLIKHMADIADKAIFIVPRINENRNLSSSQKVGIAGCNEYATNQLLDQLIKCFHIVTYAHWSKKDLGLDDDFLVFVCQGRNNFRDSI